MGILREMSQTADGIGDIARSMTAAPNEDYEVDVHADGVKKITKRGCIGCLVLSLILVGSCISVVNYCSKQESYIEDTTNRSNVGRVEVK